MSIILIGYRGSGKTTVGRKLAARLGQSFVDADDLIIKKAGKSIRDIFAGEGEATFRDHETQILRGLVALHDHVIALGGGALGREENRDALASKQHQIVYLRCRPEELHRRIQGDAGTSDNRPSLTKLGGGIEEIETMLDQREPIYKASKTVEVDVTDITPDQAVELILRML